jgi:hypothetical protein
MTMRRWTGWMNVTLVCTMVLGIVQAATAGYIPVSNYSFEGPAVTASPWYAAPATDWGAYYGGVFVNNGTYAEALPNADGNQLAFLDTIPGYELVQVLTPTYEVGNSYKMTVGVASRSYAYIGDPNDTMELRLWYTDDSGSGVLLANTTVTYGELSKSALTDYSVSLGAVNSSDAWAGKGISIALRSMTCPEGEAATWVLDNVRVESITTPEPASLLLTAMGIVCLSAYVWRKRG